MIPITTRSVPERTAAPAVSRKSEIAMMALMSGLMDWSVLLREAPILWTPV